MNYGLIFTIVNLVILSLNLNLYIKALKNKPNYTAAQNGYEPFFIGERSSPIWDRVRSAKTVKDVRGAVHYMCGEIQKMEQALIRFRK